MKRIVLVLLVGAGLAALAPAQSASDYAAVRSRLRATQTGGDTLDAADSVLAPKIASLNSTAQTHWNNLNKSASRTSLWSDLTISPTASDTITPIFDRLKTLAAAYATNGAALKGNSALRDDIVSALQFLNTTAYNPNRPFYENWFPWHLGVPLNVVDIFACLHDGLPADTRTTLYTAYATAIDFYQRTAGATFAETGANRIWRARIDVGLGAALESSVRLAAGRDKLSVVLPYVTGGDGFYADGSFIQHNIHSYTGGYGLYLIAELSAVLEALGGTPWAPTDPNLANVFRWVDEAYDPVLYRGAIMDLTRGREISRSGSTDHTAGHPTLAAIARVAQFSAPADAARFRALVKGHIQSDAFRNYLNSAALSAAALLKPILDNPAIPARAPLTGCFVFAGMDRIVHQRGAWAYAVSLSSKRIAKYESINQENLRGWHLGDGAAYLYNGQLSAYADQYWPTANPYRLAGITVDTRPRADAGTNNPNTIDPRTTKAWVGGSTVLGEFGAAGMDHEGALSDLRAKKSWFFFDQEVVHLGAGIVTSTDNPNRVETVVEHRQLSGAGNAGPAVFTAEGSVRATEPLASVRHAHLAAPMQSAYGNADIGYFFPDAPTLFALRESRSGSYNSINRGPFTSSTNQTRSYLTLWLDHGAQLTGRGASYAYTILPGFSAAQTAAYAQDPDIEILANTTTVQAVRDRVLKATGLNFWSAATVADITSSAPASLTLIERDGRLHVGLADPTQENSGTIAIELPHAAEAVVTKVPAVTVAALAPRLRLQFTVAGTRGRSLAASFKLAVAPDAAPVIARAPASVAMTAGSTVAFNVAASAQPAATYLWRKNGVALSGETSATLILRHTTAADIADYTCTVTNPLGSATTPPAALTLTPTGSAAPRLANLSVRSSTGSGAQTLIVGFVIGGGESAAGKSLLVRGLGPALVPFGVTNALADPTLTIFSGATAIATNNDWGGDPQVAATAASVGAFALATGASKDAALFRTGLDQGAYTAQITGPPGTTGVALAEIYDASPPNTPSRLANLSARTTSGPGDDVLIVGFVISGPRPQTVLLRAIGPSLAAFGVTGALADPRLELFAGQDHLLANDDWGGSATLAAVAAQSGAFALAAGSRDAALVATLAPGSYTAQVSGAATGIALIEIYEVP
jgi:hyaluronate lyase